MHEIVDLIATYFLHAFWAHSFFVQQMGESANFHLQEKSVRIILHFSHVFCVLPEVGKWKQMGSLHKEDLSRKMKPCDQRF